MAFIPMNSGKGLSTCTVVGTLTTYAYTNYKSGDSWVDYGGGSGRTSSTTISINLKTKAYSISGNSIGKYYGSIVTGATCRGGAYGAFTINSVTIV